MHYFDYAATTPLDPDAADVYTETSRTHFGNTTSLHDAGGIAQNVLGHCRQRLAELLGVHTEGIYFTSGGTESNSLALISLAQSARRKGNHLILPAAEHPSVHSAAAYLEEQGFQITLVPYNAEGFLDIKKLNEAITDQTIIVSVQHCNPEIGTIQPIRKISDAVRPKGILLHSDCVQSFGKLPIREITPYLDSLSLSSHKIYGPKGVGALYIAPRLRIVPLFPGAVHEKGLRGGTVNVPGIAAFVTAAEIAECHDDAARYRLLRNTFFQLLAPYPELFTFYGTHHKTKQLPQIIGLRVKRSEGQFIMLELNRRGFAVSTGSACKVGQQHSSMTMSAMQIPHDEAKGFLRISFGRSSTLETVEQLAGCLVEIAKEQNKDQRIATII
ncbi:IscS subfamily cysteine desulfurase [Sporosarcina cascadiensis]|uniref:IscS subfamily cysteine desulfurase n=1 Tax=Sporosarcina cascadiensis TaxID=2660747 RepID=UPI00129BB9DE|nr:IscS subfamily cysteine desulfurase [Sporosarcina cascadiensis]